MARLGHTARLLRALCAGASVFGSASAVAAIGGSAGATVTAPANHNIIGSGSSTTYQMMQALDTIFNNAPSCGLFVATSAVPQPLDFSCPPSTGDPLSVQASPSKTPENPFADVVTQEPPIGSSNGIAQLEYSNPTGDQSSVNVANNVNFARSSRNLNGPSSSSPDKSGLNFVSYATDSITWFHFKKVNSATGAGVPTASAGVANLSSTQLKDIYNGSINNWDQVGGKDAPIVVFSAQEGSGTQGTFKSWLGFDPTSSGNLVNCTNPGTFNHATGQVTGQSGCQGPVVVFENEDAQISINSFLPNQQAFLNATSLWGGHAATNVQIQGDAIFFFSEGKFSQQCAAGDCGGTKPGNAVPALGEIDGATATEASTLTGTFPITRFLYNVYSNGSNPKIAPAASPATLNVIGEDGFICKPQNAFIKDPSTGKTYTSEIQQAILSSGFYPLSAGMTSGTVNAEPIDEGNVGHPAASLYGGSPYARYDNTPQSKLKKNKAGARGPIMEANGDPAGFCQVSTTDGGPS